MSKTLANRLKTIFSDTNNKLNEILPSKINNVINQKLDLFSDKVEYLIPTSFIENMINMITSKEMIDTLNKPKIYSLLSKSFTDGFKANLTTILASKLNVGNYKDNFITKLTNKLNVITNTLNTYNTKMSITCNIKTQTILKSYMNLIREDYESFQGSLDNYKEIYNLPVQQDKKDSILKFLVNEIYPNIKQIIDSFEKEKKEQENNITTQINAFSASGVLLTVQTNLTNTNISIIITAIEKSLTTIMNDLANSMANKFNSIGNILQKEFTTPLTGFTLKPKTRMRNLQSKKYYLKEINQILDQIQEKYNDFRDNVLKNHNFVSVYTKIGSFKKLLNNSANHITEYFYSYQLLLSDYIDPLIALKKIETEAQSIKNHLYNWLTNQTGGIGKTVVTIKERVINSWNEAKNKIDTSLTSYLNLFLIFFSLIFKI